MKNTNKINTFISMKKKDELFYNAWNEHLNNTKERTYYSIKRMDLLIISICGAGIYIIFETLREFKVGNIDINDSWLILVSGIFLLIGIISNFFSQMTGYYSNTNEEKYANLEISKLMGNKINECEQEISDNKVGSFNFWTNLLNGVSLVTMLLGLIFLVIFNYLLFW